MSKDSQESRKGPERAGSPYYVGFMVFFWYMTLYSVFFALGGLERNRDLAVGYLLSQSPLPILAVIMTYFRIRYRIKYHLRPHPVRFMKERLLWFRNFLFPYRYRFAPSGPAVDGPGTLVDSFRKEYEQFYANEDLGANVTQMYRHQLLLHRRRLQDLGLTVRTGWARMGLEKETPLRSEQFADGKMKRVLVSEYLKGEQTYLHGSAKEYTMKGDYAADTDVIGVWNAGAAADAEGRKFRCPGCGGISTGKELVTGCPYCGKSFLMEDLQDRVCAYSLYKDPFLDRKLFGLKVNGHLNRLAAVFTVIELFTFVDMVLDALRAGDPLSMLPFLIILGISTMVLIFVMALAFNYVVTLPLRYIANKVYKAAQERRSEELKAVRLNQARLPQIHKYDPDFSLHSFLSNVRNKVASVHYAANAQEMEVFTEADLSSYLTQYAPVADCLFGPVVLHDYRAAGNERTADVSVQLRLLVQDGSKLKEKQEHLRLQLARLQEKKDRNPNPYHIHSLRCDNCGASLDLTKGNICSHCGTRWSVRQYDWCIVSYRQEEGTAVTR